MSSDCVIERHLSEPQQGELAAQEMIIERGLSTFVEVGTALLNIRDKRLYRQDYATFEDYCRERWGMSRPRAYQLMDAAGVVSNLSTIVDTPANEAQARLLTPYAPEEQRAIWQAVQEAVEPGQRITANTIAETAHE